MASSPGSNADGLHGATLGNRKSEFYLMQSFKRHTGQTPTQWRGSIKGPARLKGSLGK
jgi:hypothetical protein